jgi:hypothetical protein
MENFFKGKKPAAGDIDFGIPPGVVFYSQTKLIFII